MYVVNRFIMSFYAFWGHFAGPAPCSETFVLCLCTGASVGHCTTFQGVNLGVNQGVEN